jgi:gamma-glutamylcyclotransferase (GGCT)/AIG2-like uncharacterized protein YtfP
MELEYLFVYGVFRDAGNSLLRSNNSLENAIFCDKAFVFGRIYGVNDFYPGYVRISCDNRVYGDVYLVDPSVFTELDEFEGDEYERKKIWTSIGEECWIYEYKYDVSQFKEIIGGDWILR